MDVNGTNRYQLLVSDDESVQEQDFSSKKDFETDNRIRNNAVKSKIRSTTEKENKLEIINKHASNQGSEVVSRKGKSFKDSTDKYLNGNSVAKGERNETRFTRNKDFGQAGPGTSGKERSVHIPTERTINRHKNFDRAGKREFDRQSGSDKTGVKSVEKKNGAGAHNWGSLKQEIKDVGNATNDTEIPVVDREDSVGEKFAENEDEVREMTLDEWKALNKNRSKPHYNLRKAGEGEDTAQWKKMVILNKKKENESEDEYEFDPSLYPQRVGRLQRITDIKINFNDGKRGFAKGRERAFRNDYGDEDKVPRRFNLRQQKCNNSNILKVDDEHQFPTLGQLH